MTRRSFSRAMAQNLIANQEAVITEAMDSMNPALRDEFQKITAALDSTRSNNIRTCYQIGQICKKIQDNPDKYGKDGITKIMKAIHGHKRFIARCLRFVENYTPQEMQRIVDMRNDRLRFSLCWEHINYALVDYLTKEAAITYLQRAVDAGWKAKEMFKVIQDENPREGRHGRTHSQPTNALEVVQSVLNQLNMFVAKDDSVYQTSFYPLLADVKEDEVNEDLLSSINDLNGTIDLVTISLRRLKNDLSRTKPKILEHLTNKVGQVSPEVREGFVLNIGDVEDEPEDTTDDLLKQALEAANLT